MGGKKIIGQRWFELFIPQNIKEEIRYVFKTTVLHKDPLDFLTYENDIVTRSCELRHIAWANVLTKGAQGQVLDTTCLGVDLTERIDEEKAEAIGIKGFWVKPVVRSEMAQKVR